MWTSLLQVRGKAANIGISCHAFFIKAVKFCPQCESKVEFGYPLLSPTPLLSPQDR